MSDVYNTFTLVRGFIMPANVETMAFVGQKPWHGIGEEISGDDVFNLDVFEKRSGLNWSVDVCPLFRKVVVKDDKGFDVVSYKQVESGAISVRSSDDSELGILGPNSTVLQNRDAFKFFQPFLDTKQAQLHTAGSLDNGRIVWVLAKLALDNATIVPGDEVEKFVMLSNSHDGTRAVRVGFTPVRVVCANTLAMAHRSNASKLIAVRHTPKTMMKNLENIRDIMNLANAEFEATAAQYRLLAAKGINQADIRKYVKVVFGKGDVADEDLSKQFESTISDITVMAATGRGTQIPGIRGTYWGLYNSLTEYLNYNRGHSNTTRLQSLWFGQNAELNKLALETAIAMAA